MYFKWHELHLPQELHYSNNGTVWDYLYFLVDGIYPKWPIFVSTVSDEIPGSKDKMFATHQEAVRKDIEQAFGQIVKKFDILSRSIQFQKKEVIGNVLNTCIILHNIQHRNDANTMSVNRCIIMICLLMQLKMSHSLFLEASR